MVWSNDVKTFHLLTSCKQNKFKQDSYKTNIFHERLKKEAKNSYLSYLVDKMLSGFNLKTQTQTYQNQIKNLLFPHQQGINRQNSIKKIIASGKIKMILRFI